MLFSVRVVFLEDETLVCVLVQLSGPGLLSLSAQVTYLICYEVYFY